MKKKSVYIKTKGTSGYLKMKMYLWSKSFTCFSPGVISTKQKGARQPGPSRVFFNYYRTSSSLSNLSFFHEGTISKLQHWMSLSSSRDNKRRSNWMFLSSLAVSRTSYCWGQLIGCYGLKGESSKGAPTTRGHFPGYESRWSFTGFYTSLYSTQLRYRA